LPPLAELGYRLTLQRDVAAVGGQQARDDIQQRAFATAGGPEQGDDLSRIDAERNRLQHLLRVEMFADLAKLNNGRSGSGQFLKSGAHENPLLS